MGSLWTFSASSILKNYDPRVSIRVKVHSNVLMISLMVMSAYIMTDQLQNEKYTHYSSCQHYGNSYIPPTIDVTLLLNVLIYDFPSI